VDFTLAFSALLMGLAGSVHCVAMCGAASAAAVRTCGGQRLGWNWAGFHLGRLLGYAAAGAVGAASVAVLARLGTWSPALRPLWVMAHMLALGLGLWLLWQGRQPAWLDRLGRDGGHQINAASLGAPQSGWHRMVGPGRAAAVGSVWFAWPCGLLQSALMVAALANTPLRGAAVMAVFALASSLALGVGPLLWVRWLGRGSHREGRLTVMVVRVSGAALALASTWALGHDLFERFAAWCLS
jgi:uncharacterized protein